MKKTLFIILILGGMLALKLPIAIASNEKDILFYDNFEGYGNKRMISYVPNGWTGDSFYKDGNWAKDFRTFMQIENEGGNNVLKIASLPTFINNNGMLFRTISIKDSGVIEFKFKIGEIDGAKKVLLQRKSASFELLTIQDGKLYGNSLSKPLMDVQPNKWYSGSIILDTKTPLYYLFIDEKNLAKEGIAIKNVAFTDDFNVAFQVKGAESGTNYSTLFLDDVKMYNSDRVIKPALWGKYKSSIQYDLFGMTNDLLTDKYSNKINEMIRGAVFFAAGGSKAYTDNRIIECPAPLKIKNEVYLPIDFTVKSFGVSNISVDEYADLVVTENNIKFLQADILAKLLGKEVVYDKQMTTSTTVKISELEDRRQFVALCNTNNVVDINDNEFITEIIQRLYFTRPDATQITKDYNNYGALKSFPRMHLEDGGFVSLKAKIENNEELKRWFQVEKEHADTYIDAPLTQYEMSDGIRIMVSTRRLLDIIPLLAYVYNITGEEKYAQRAVKEMLNTASFPTWQPGITLSTGEAMTAMSQGYDWLYNYMNEEQRQLIASAIYEKGLLPLLEAYKDTSLKFNMSMHWVKQQNNWNAVVNGSALMAATAMFEKYPEVCSEIIAGAFRSLEYYLINFYPDGGSDESPMYWDYAMRYFAWGMSACSSTLGTDYGYTSVPGVKTTGEFPIYMTGRYSVAYHDATSTPVNAMEIMYFARQVDNNDLGAVRYQQLVSGKYTPTIYDLMWVKDEFMQLNKKMNLPTDKYFRPIETGSMRKSWEDPNGIFMSFHAGENGVQHTQLDAGAFELEALNEHWIWDLGADSATYVPTGESYGRYDLYRYRPEGNNTVVINPSLLPGQRIPAWSPIVDFVSKPKGSFAIADLTKAYADYVTEFKRGYMLTDDRTKVIVQDELTLLEPSKFYWSVNTKADIKLAQNRKSAVLSQNGKQVWVGLSSSSNATFAVTEAVPLATSPIIKTQVVNTGVKKLCVTIPKVDKLTFSVTFVPIMPGDEEIPKVIPTTPLSKWSIPDGEINILPIKSITVDGKLIKNFTVNRSLYEIQLPFEMDKYPLVVAQTSEGYYAEINQKDCYSIIKIKSYDDPDYNTECMIKFIYTLKSGEPEGIQHYNVDTVFASDTPQASYIPENVIDEDMGDESRWSSVNDQWLILDLGMVKPVSYAAISFMSGNARTNTFEIYTSNDYVEWKSVGEYTSSGTTSDFETYPLLKSDAQYIKFSFHGNSKSSWNSIKEVRVYPPKSEAGDIR